jgi:ABC-2 type transport system permease protein
MLRRIWAVMQKEFIQTFRAGRTLIILLTMPVLQLFLFGYAINMNVDHIPMVVADQSRDAASQAYVDALVNSGFFDVTGYASDQAGVMQAIDEGRVQAGVVIPPDFAARVERGDAQALLLVDGADLFTSLSAYNAGNAIAQMHATQVTLEKVERAGLAVSMESLLPLEARVRVLYNPNMDDLWFLIPTMVAMLLQTQCISLTAAAIVREREVGTIEQILVTPIRPLELMLGKIAPNLLIAMINMVTIVGAGFYWFHVPFQGNFGLFCGLSFVYAFSGLGLGILVSTVAENQKQAVQLIMAILMMAIVLGGFIFPRYTMPKPIQLVGNLFPLTYFVPIAQSVITKGVGLQFFWKHALAVLVYVIVIVFAAGRAFRQGVD